MQYVYLSSKTQNHWNLSIHFHSIHDQNTVMNKSYHQPATQMFGKKFEYKEK